MGVRERLEQGKKRKRELPRLKRLAQRLEEFITGHNKLSDLVNRVIMPNIQELAKMANQITSLSTMFADHVILMYIIKRKLSITDEEYQETKARLYNRATQNPQPGSVQPKDAGSDEDRSPDGQPQLLDAEGGGGDDVGGGSIPVREHAGGPGSDPQDAGSGAPTAGAGEDKAGYIIIEKKSAAMGCSEQQIGDITLVEPTEEGRRSY